MFTVRVKKKTERKVNDDGLVSISTTGDVITAGASTDTLCKFSLQQDGSYSTQWRRQLPKYIRSMSTEYNIYLTDTGDVILQTQEENSKTFLFDQDMNLKDSWQHHGQLIGCLPGPRTVYAVREAKGILVEIRSQNGESMQLKPERNAWDSIRLSVCEDGRTGKLVVVQWSYVITYRRTNASKRTNVMDIFSGVGKIKHQIIMQIEMCLESGGVKGNYYPWHKRTNNHKLD